MVRQVSPPGGTGIFLYYLITTNPKGEPGGCANASPSPPGPPPRPPPARDGSGATPPPSPAPLPAGPKPAGSGNATGVFAGQKTYSILLNLKNLTDTASLKLVEQGALLSVTGFPLASRGAGAGSMNSVLLVTRLRTLVDYSGGREHVLNKLVSADPTLESLTITVGVAILELPSFEDGGGAPFQAAEVEANWLGEAVNLTHMLYTCSLGKVQLGMADFAQPTTTVVLTGIDLSVIGDSASKAAKAAGLGSGRAQWGVCVGMILDQLQASAEAQLLAEGSTLGTVWEHVLFALPSAVDNAINVACSDLKAGDEGSSSDTNSLVTDWMADMKIASQLNCRNRTDKEVCGASFAGVDGDTTLVKAAFRALGINFGLRHALPSADSTSAMDTSSGLSGADAICFNGPQSWLLGWAEIATGLDLVWDMDNQAAMMTQQRFTLPAYGSTFASLMRLRVQHGGGSAAYTTFWVTFRPFKGNATKPLDFFKSTSADSVNLYEMASEREQRIALSPDPIWWGSAGVPVKLNDRGSRVSVWAPVQPPATSEGTNPEPPLAYLKLWPEIRTPDQKNELTVSIRMCLVSSAGATPPPPSSPIASPQQRRPPPTLAPPSSAPPSSAPPPTASPAHVPSPTTDAWPEPPLGAPPPVPAGPNPFLSAPSPPVHSYGYYGATAPPLPYYYGHGGGGAGYYMPPPPAGPSYPHAPCPPYGGGAYGAGGGGRYHPAGGYAGEPGSYGTYTADDPTMCGGGTGAYAAAYGGHPAGAAHAGNNSGGSGPGPAAGSGHWRAGGKPAAARRRQQRVYGRRQLQH
ncbi:hypothetical protein HXX76_000434 [Chlamydomonas incerta]|uniref:Uncharacterized protein n=1 Tax=Chlamydomonas incerta TaxID=51695 RepID=A0A835WEU8_CHLIN|nr:hypothetical protein HXX76_000434 [Chlamydomonas incerta]|eukprot:KAG2445830.1 hypothetical protein HXX76_000434 [Chlamydomonas incerta]